MYDGTIWGFYPLGIPAELTAQYPILKFNLKDTGVWLNVGNKW